jgi:hypothetical protein
MDESLFVRVGRCLGGYDFADALSDALAINRRTVQRWAAGTMYPPREVWERLGVLLDEHANEAAGLLIELAEQLRRHGDEG